METIEGVIEQIESKTGKTERGPWTKYSFKVNGKFISTFDAKVGQSLQAGKAYSFEVERKGDYLNLAKDTTPEEVAFPLPEEGQAPHLPSNAYQDTKDLSIRRQVALKAAVELVGYIMEHSNKKYIGPERVLSIAEGFDAWLNRAEDARPFDPAQAERDKALWDEQGGPIDTPEAETPPQHQARGSSDQSEGPPSGDNSFQRGLRDMLREKIAATGWKEATIPSWCKRWGGASVDEIPAERLEEALEWFKDK